jgi:hypothetical protein
MTSVENLPQTSPRRKVDSRADSYPKRPPHFDRIFLRKLVASGAANEIGSDGVLLLMTIVLREDEVRYRPVGFWNPQLVQALGVRSEDTLARVRARCVAAGWLHYEPGSRTRQAVYWVVLPSDAPEYHDDEQPQDCGTSISHANVTVASRKGNAKVTLDALPARTSATERQFARSMCGTSIPTPSPVPKYIAAGAADCSEETQETEPSSQLKQLADAIAEATGCDPMSSGLHNLLDSFSKAEPPYEAYSVRIFANQWSMAAESNEHPGTFIPWEIAVEHPCLTLDIIEKHFPAWRARHRDSMAYNRKFLEGWGWSMDEIIDTYSA